MSAVAASMVKELRQLTGAGMSDCKKALVETDGDVEAARDWLRARGAALAERKAGRETTEGLIAVAGTDNKGVLVEILAETDFVTSNQVFRSFADNVAQAVLAHDSAVGELEQMNFAGKSVEELRAEAMLQIGENIQLGRFHFLEAKGELAHYVHHDGKIGVIADFEGLDEAQQRQVCMHIAAMKPKALNSDSFSADELEHHRKYFAEAAAQSGKPAAVQAKIVEGKVGKLIAESTLLLQDYVWEDKLTVRAFLEQNKASLTSYQLLYIGG